MRHADVELHRRTMHRSGSGRSAATTTATFVVSSPSSAAFSADAKPDLLSLDSPSQRNALRGGARGQGKPRKYLCVMCDASFLQKAHLVSKYPQKSEHLYCFTLALFILPPSAGYAR